MDRDAAQVPLIGESSEEEFRDVSSTASAFLWLLTFSASLSGLQFGYDTGVISSTLVAIGSDLSGRPLSTLDKSLITSSTSLFALFASPVAGLLADAYGRKKMLLIADVLFVAGSISQMYTTSVLGMILGRSLIGLAIGGASLIAPLYIAELSPTFLRGRLVTISVLMITGGQVVAYFTGWLFSTSRSGWRGLIGIGAIPALFQFVFILFLPDTPRWLVKVDQKESARLVLKRVYGFRRDAGIVADTVLEKIENDMTEENLQTGRRMMSENISSGGIKATLANITERFSDLVSIGGNRRALIIACMLQASQQLCGFNSLMYFSATIFLQVGFKSPTLVSLTIAVTNFLFTLVAFYAIDRTGRRRILLLSIPIMILGLIVCSIAFTFLDSHVGHAVTGPSGNGSKAWPLVVLVAMIIYVAGYAIGLGLVPWQQSELFSFRTRSLGSSLSTATNWISNTIVGLTFLPMMEGLTPSVTFALYAVVCIVSWLGIKRIYPETAGLGLEEVRGLLKDDWGVEESVIAHRERRKAQQK